MKNNLCNFGSYLKHRADIISMRPSMITEGSVFGSSLFLANPLLSPSWYSSNIWTKDPIFLFWAGSYKLYIQYCSDVHYIYDYNIACISERTIISFNIVKKSPIIWFFNPFRGRTTHSRLGFINHVGFYKPRWDLSITLGSINHSGSYKSHWCLRPWSELIIPLLSPSLDMILPGSWDFKWYPRNCLIKFSFSLTTPVQISLKFTQMTFNQWRSNDT